MTFLIRTFILLLAATIIFGCKNDKPSSNNSINYKEELCKYGAPTPIFSKDLEKVLGQEFSVNGQKGNEKVSFENGLELELLQSGCDELLQSYQFSLSKDLEGDDKFWIEKAAEQFRYLATLSENHLSFNLWAGAIQNASENVSLGESFEPDANTFIKIDKIPSGDKTILVVTLEAK